MILPDANLLLYACDAGSPFHPKAAAWWERLDAEVHTADLDFGRFAGARFSNPL